MPHPALAIGHHQQLQTIWFVYQLIQVRSIGANVGHQQCVGTGEGGIWLHLGGYLIVQTHIPREPVRPPIQAQGVWTMTYGLMSNLRR